MEGAAGLGSASYDVSLLSPFSYIHNTVGCFNYSPSVGESKPLQRHTLIPPPFFLFSLQATHCLLNIISLSSTHTIGLKCGSFAEGGVWGWGWSGGRGERGVAIWVFKLSPRSLLSLVTAFQLHLLQPTERADSRRCSSVSLTDTLLCSAIIKLFAFCSQCDFTVTALLH